MTDTGLPTETLDGFAAWHDTGGIFMLQSLREFDVDVIQHLGSKRIEAGWRVVPVTITITARGTGKTNG